MFNHPKPVFFSPCINLELPIPHLFCHPFSLKRLKAPHCCLLSLPCSRLSQAGVSGLLSRQALQVLSLVCHVLQRGPNTGHGLLGGTQQQTDWEWHQHIQRLLSTNVYKRCEQYGQLDMLHEHSNHNYTTSSTAHTDTNFFNHDLQSYKISM